MTAAGYVIDKAVQDPAEREAGNQRMRALLSSPDPGPVAEHLALLHFTGRRSGTAYTVPAGVHRWRDGLVVATGSGWRHNFAGGLAGELTWRGSRVPVRFVLVDDPAEVAAAHHELIQRYGVQTAQRRLGLVLGGEPTPEQVAEAVERCGLGLVHVVVETEGAPTS